MGFGNEENHRIDSEWRVGGCMLKSPILAKQGAISCFLRPQVA